MAGTGSGSKHTASMKQYFQAKGAHPDAILFFRLGDFYEMFYEDAVLVSRELDLTLTSRNKNAADEVPMAGVPYHSAHQYIGKLLNKGYKVAICEQMGDPSKTRGIVHREVVRVITPGLVTDSDHLDAKRNLFLAGVEPDGDSFGLALFDLSTGELRATRLGSGRDLLGELARSAPRELLLGPVDEETKNAIQALLTGTALRDDGGMTATQARALLLQHLAGTELEQHLARFDPAALAASARVVRLAAACSPGTRMLVRSIETWDVAETLLLDDVAQKHLELVASSDGGKVGSLLHLLDSTCTPGGARLLRRRLLAPLVDVEKIRRRHDAVEVFFQNPASRSDFRAALGNVADLERLAVRAALQEATPKDLGSLRDSLAMVPMALGALATIPDPAPEVLGLLSEPVDILPELQQLLARALVDRPPAIAREGGIFRPGYSAELDELKDLKDGGTQKLSEMENRLRAETGVATLKVKYTRVFGWYIEVTDRHLSKVPPTWRRKQTVANAERYTNDELDLLSDRVLHAEEQALALEQQLYKDLLAQVAAVAPRLHRLAARLADWDVHAALADIAHRHGYCRPEVDSSLALDLVDARHPVVERTAAAGQFVPNDIRLDVEGERFWLITGPNMSGKSTLMRQAALLVLMAQMGSFVPASSAKIGIVDRILSRVGASDNVSRGESTFMVEMRETSAILKAATRRSLVILDEIGRGTSTYDGLAIAWAVAEHLHDVIQCRALFATHYHEITELTKLAKNAANYSVSAREFGDDIVFLHKIARGAASRSYGIAVAKLAGLPESVLARSRAILDSLESSGMLPVGTHASLRRRDRQGRAQPDVQLGLFEPPANDPAKHPAVETLRSVEPERLTPLDALQLVIKLKGLVQLRCAASSCCSRRPQPGARGSSTAMCPGRSTGGCTSVPLSPRKLTRPSWKALSLSSSRIPSAQNKPTAAPPPWIAGTPIPGSGSAPCAAPAATVRAATTPLPAPPVLTRRSAPCSGSKPAAPQPRERPPRPERWRSKQWPRTLRTRSLPSCSRGWRCPPTTRRKRAAGSPRCCSAPRRTQERWRSCGSTRRTQHWRRWPGGRSRMHRYPSAPPPRACG
jgi:DNA mismatch repair protein MutS